MLLLHLPLTPLSTLSPLSIHFKPKINPLHLPISLPSKIPIKPSLKPLNSTRTPSLLPSSPQTLESLSKIKPYLQSQYKTILSGWLCSLVSVLSLSQIVPRIGSFASSINNNHTANIIKFRDEGLLLGALILVRLLATYCQQAFLWEAALNAVYKIRVSVFEMVLERELGFFEGGSGVSPGDIAYRITAEASDVADTVYALLNAIPCMALVVACLGERLRKISKKAHLSIATLSAYLNEVLPAILFVKANNAVT